MGVSLSRQEQLALGMFEQDSHLIDVARRAAGITGSPVLGGVAVFLHGYRRTTEDVDLFVTDTDAAAEAIQAAGALWDESAKQHTLDGVPIHLVTEQQTGSAPRSTVVLQGVTVVALPDLIAFKLHSGLGRVERAKDLADVVELIRCVPLDKAFAPQLPAHFRNDFKKLVQAVHPGGPAQDENT
ncbi:MAG: hypothetical protein IH985_08300 [Planctomycetes bacterium]|nr:hypothetical protein [Planctomycetota bacterium]